MNTDSSVARRRELLPDALKGLAIILVLVGHAIFAAGDAVSAAAPDGVADTAALPGISTSVLMDPIVSTLYAFHMPLFAFVSGLVMWRLVPPPLAGRIKRSAQALLVPYFAWFCIYYFVGTLRRTEREHGFFPTLLRAAFDVDTEGTLWFLYVLFLCVVLLQALAALPFPQRAVVASALVVVASTAVPALNTPLLGLVHFRWIYPFVAAGFLVAANRARLERWIARITVAGAALFVPLAAVRYPSHLPELSVIGRVEQALNAAVPPVGSVAEVLVAYLTAAAAVAAIWGGYLMLARAGGSSSARKALLAQAWIGRRSLGVYAVHALVNLAFVALGVSFWPAIFVGSLVGSLALILVLERVPVLNAVLARVPETRTGYAVGA